MSKIEVNEIDKTTGSTLTIGGSGTTVQLGTGASQTGFGRTGTVDWQTTKKTANFTAVNGEGYFVDTSGGAVTMTLPASPSAGNIVAVKDYNGTFSSNNLTIGRNGSPINGGSDADAPITDDGASITLVYVDATQGWLATNDDSSTFSGESFIVATGGTITTCGDCKIHTFTGPGTFTVSGVSGTSDNNIVSHLIVAGGGGGGCDVGGGGGAGGYREVKNPVTPYTASPLDGYPSAPNRITVTAAAFPITVGGGGAASSYPPTSQVPGSAGANSVFSTITSAGGGGGGGSTSSPGPAINGGSGGGAYRGCRTGGTGNSPPVSPAQGTNGGNSGPGSGGSGGGGGATAVGAAGVADNGGGAAGGAGATSSINGTPTARAGGGGGGTRNAPSNTSPGGAGGAGGGGAGNGGGPTGVDATAGTANTGGGGGGTTNAPGAGGNGGSGIVIIRYKFK
tara:strand:+ start:114 stop:1469 length:1356 start_codon:yes stop_codon:yes gene_type:complete